MAFLIMEKTQKTTIILPVKLLKSAQAVSGKGITPTIREALELLASRKSYDKMLELKNSYRSSLDIKKLREDR